LKTRLLVFCVMRVFAELNPRIEFMALVFSLCSGYQTCFHWLLRESRIKIENHPASGELLNRDQHFAEPKKERGSNLNPLSAVSCGLACDPRALERTGLVCWHFWRPNCALINSAI